MGWTLLAGLALHRAHGPNTLDRWGFALLSPARHSSLLIRITELGDVPVLVVASVGAALVVVRRDRWRASACLCGPALATLLVEWYVKPLVDRHFLGVLTFPSGSVTTMAALATAWVLAVGSRLRWVVAPMVTLVVVSMAWAVVGLRWHYPSDALGGAAFGVGMLLLVDGVLHLLSARPPVASPDRAEQGARSDPLGVPPGHPQL